MRNRVRHILRAVLHMPRKSPARPLHLAITKQASANIRTSRRMYRLSIGRSILGHYINRVSIPPIVTLAHELRHVLPTSVTVHNVTPTPGNFSTHFSTLRHACICQVTSESDRISPHAEGFMLRVSSRLSLGTVGRTTTVAVNLRSFNSFTAPGPNNAAVHRIGATC